MQLRKSTKENRYYKLVICIKLHYTVNPTKVNYIRLNYVKLWGYFSHRRSDHIIHLMSYERVSRLSPTTPAHFITM